MFGLPEIKIHEMQSGDIVIETYADNSYGVSDVLYINCIDNGKIYHTESDGEKSVYTFDEALTFRYYLVKRKTNEKM